MKYIVFFLLSLLFWLLITADVQWPNLVIGGIVSVVTTLIFGKYYFDDVSKLFQPQRYFWFLIYLVIFTWECIKANFDVAYRVLHPALPVKPGIVKIKLRVKSKIARTFLANSITMTPGTISVDIIGDYLYVHWIYVHNTDPEKYTHEVSGRFENYIEKIFE
jgi:multicomponent Na+:H+ antiporter subunit E